MTVTKTSIVPFALTATGTGTAQHLTAAGDAGHRFSTDAYPAFGGKDAAPSPLFYALGSLTSCNQVTATLVAETERRCPVSQLFKRSGVEWNSQWENAPLPEAD